jgi:hypothetical protein
MGAPNPDSGDLGDRDEPESPTAASSEPLADADVEARWAEIIDRLGEVDAPDDVPRAHDEGAAGPRLVVPVTPEPEERPAGPRDWPTTPEIEALEEDESHFTPPEPEPVLSHDPLLTLAWALAVGVPVLTVLGVIVRSLVPTLAIPSWLGPLAGALFMAGVAVLVWRMPHRRDPEDTDPGAVV